MTKREQENFNIRSKLSLEETKIMKKMQLPDFDKFKKMNMISLNPPLVGIIKQGEEEKKNFKFSKLKKKEPIKKYTSKEDNQEEIDNNINKSLFNLANDHIYMFQKITKKVVHSKYKKIFEDIYHFIIKLDFYRDNFLQTLIINTDQNADMFFDIMESYFMDKQKKQEESENNQNKIKIHQKEQWNCNKRNYNFTILKESNFYDLKNLFMDLQLYEDRDIGEDADMDVIPKSNIITDELNTPKIEIFESFKPLPANIIIIREIHLINPVYFNIFLTKLIEFHQTKNKKFSNIILFDVSYDPKGLFEKIKPHILTKIVFNNLDYISSKSIYKEILYDFVHGSKKISESNEFSFFIPNSQKTKKIIDYVTTHQISIASFEYYFKFLILEFFVFRKWSNMNFLIYHLDLSTKLNKINMDENNRYSYSRDEYLPLVQKFFEKKLKSILMKEKLEESYLKNLVEMYLKFKNTREIFLAIYEFFETIVEKLNGFDNKYNKYDFIFDFLQFGEDVFKINIKRTDLIMSFVSKESKYYLNLIKNLLIPELDSLSKQLIDESEEKSKIIELKNELEAIIKSNDEFHFKDMKIFSKKYNNLFNLNGTNSNLDLDNELKDQGVCLLNDGEIFTKLKSIIMKFFDNKFFKDFDTAANMKEMENQQLSEVEWDHHTNADFDVSSILHSKELKITQKYFLNQDLDQYLRFEEITNPSMQSMFLNDILSLQFVKYDKNLNNKSSSKITTLKKNDEFRKNTFNIGSFLITRANVKSEIDIDRDNFLNNINYSKLFKIFVFTYGGLGLEFKLKFFFSDFLVKLKLELGHYSINKIDQLRNVFLKFCHEFYLLGLISRKRPNSDVFVKNFFKMTKYFQQK